MLLVICLVLEVVDVQTFIQGLEMCLMLKISLLKQWSQQNSAVQNLVKSNINDWIVCQPNGGSLVTRTQGSTNCQNIKNVATACNGVVPYRIDWSSRGPYLNASWLYYYFDGYTGSSWPTHDPCGKNRVNYKKGVSNPGGQIYLR